MDYVTGRGDTFAELTTDEQSKVSLEPIYHSEMSIPSVGGGVRIFLHFKRC